MVSRLVLDQGSKQMRPGVDLLGIRVGGIIPNLLVRFTRRVAGWGPLGVAGILIAMVMDHSLKFPICFAQQ